MHTNTEGRWDQVRTLNPFIMEMLSYKHNDENQLIKNTSEIYDEYEDPIHIISSKVYSSMASYRNHYFVAPEIEYLSQPIPSLKKNNFLF